MPTQPATMTTSDFNLEKLNTKDLSDHVGASIRMGGNIAVFGRRGTGKTEIAKYQIQRADCQEVYMNLSVLERVDMGGYPNILAASQQKEFVNFLLPQFYEQMMHGKKPVVALLDEVDKADPSLWAPLLEFTQFRSINGKPLPHLQAIIMTGNLISEGGSRPSLPLLDRAEKYLVEADVNSWLDWAGKSGRIHPSVSAYIHDHPKDLFGAVDPENDMPTRLLVVGIVLLRFSLRVKKWVGTLIYSTRRLPDALVKTQASSTLTTTSTTWSYCLW